MQAVEYSRLRWQCRRGMLENDLVLERFLELHAGNLEGDKLAAFKRLLECDDTLLWEVVCGRAVPEDPAGAEVARMLAACVPGRIGDSR